MSCMHGRVSLSLSLPPSLSLPTVTVVEKVAHHDPCSPPEALSHVSLAAEKRVCIVVILLSLNKSSKEEKGDEVRNSQGSGIITDQAIAFTCTCVWHILLCSLGMWKCLNHSQGNTAASSKYYRLVGSVATTPLLPPSLPPSLPRVV